MRRNGRKNKKTEHVFACRTCGEVSVAPANGTFENRLWRQAWVDAGKVACCECLDVFHHETLSVIEVTASQSLETPTRV